MMRCMGLLLCSVRHSLSAVVALFVFALPVRITNPADGGFSDGFDTPRMFSIPSLGLGRQETLRMDGRKPACTANQVLFSFQR